METIANDATMTTIANDQRNLATPGTTFSSSTIESPRGSQRYLAAPGTTFSSSTIGSPLGSRRYLAPETTFSSPLGSQPSLAPETTFSSPLGVMQLVEFFESPRGVMDFVQEEAETENKVKKVRFCIDTTNTTLNNPSRQNHKTSVDIIDKKVSFDFSRNKEYTIGHVKDIKNIDALWYVKSDFQDILVENKETLQLLRNRWPERRNHCFRGLEYTLPLARRMRRATIAKARNIVKVYQERNAAELPRRYARYARPSRNEAYRVGLEDAKVARAILSTSSMENNPRTRRLDDIPKNPFPSNAQDRLRRTYGTI
jgi:hypothetical protein